MRLISAMYDSATYKKHTYKSTMAKTKQMGITGKQGTTKILPIVSLLFVFILSASIFLTLLVSNSTDVYALNNETEYIDVTAGSSYYTQLNSSFFETQRWAGIKVIHNAIQLSEGTLPFLSSIITTPGVVEAAFPGVNHEDFSHYYIATEDSVFNISKMRNITSNDLLAYQLFNITDYPQFYTNWSNPINDVYYGKSDNPNATFAGNGGNLTTILVGALNVSVYHITLNYNYDYYVGKYDYNGKEVPMFIAPHESTLCYNQTTCYAQFLMPVSQNITWNFFSINRLGAYTFDVYVDGSLTTIIPNTAKPYNITMRAYNLYTGSVSTNLTVAIGERDGQNIFVPYRLSGYVSRAYSLGLTDSNGFETFIAAPTVYPATANYSFFVAAVVVEDLTSMNDLSIASANQLTFGSKNLSPQSVYDNAKTSINAMNQISSFLFRWASIREKAINLTITYDLLWDNYTIRREPGSNSDFQLQTGIPHIFSFVVLNGSVPTSASRYFGIIHQTGGYLILNPYTDTAPLTDTIAHHSWRLPQNSPVIIVPTSLGSVSSNVSFEIIDLKYHNIALINATTIPTLSITENGVDYSDDLLKTVVNAINQVLYSLYVALNT